MFAPDRSAALQVRLKLLDDEFIAHQGIYVRKYHQLKNYGFNVVEQPIAEEYRFFIYKTTVLASGFYWSANLEDLNVRPNPDVVPRDFIDKITTIVSHSCNAYVIDVAQDIDGKWWLVELNSIEMSGLSECDPVELYGNLAKAIRKDNNA